MINMRTGLPLLSCMSLSHSGLKGVHRILLILSHLPSQVPSTWRLSEDIVLLPFFCLKLHSAILSSCCVLLVLTADLTGASGPVVDVGSSSEYLSFSLFQLYFSWFLILLELACPLYPLQSITLFLRTEAPSRSKLGVPEGPLEFNLSLVI